MAAGVLVGTVHLNIQQEEPRGRKKRKHTPLPQIPSLPLFLVSLLNTLHKETNPSTPQLLRSIAKAISFNASPEGNCYIFCCI
jgi:hypothetical protein